MYKRLLQRPLQGRQSFFLFGPRGTGKTFWVRDNIPGGIYIDLLQGDLFIELSSNPQKIENLIPEGFRDWIIIDEVQKIPQLLNEVHRLIESKEYKFVLTGSSARSLKRKGVNLLAGRALSFKMFPLTALELGNDFLIKNSLRYGHLPYVFSKKKLQEIQDYLEAYTQTYLKEEVMQEGLTRNIGAFSRFLQIASFSQGSILNISEVAREASIHRKVVEDYFQILEDLLLAKRVPIFTKKAKRKTVAHPKFYFFDVGVYRAVRPLGPYDISEEVDGVALESLVYQELEAINHYFDYKYDFYFWRTVDQIEIDFVLYGPRGVIGIEVKRSEKVSDRDLRGLQAFAQDYPEAKLFFLYGGIQKQYNKKITILPVDEALRSLDKLL